jgi:hypothetical protein
MKLGTYSVQDVTKMSTNKGGVCSNSFPSSSNYHHYKDIAVKHIFPWLACLLSSVFETKKKGFFMQVLDSTKKN